MSKFTLHDENTAPEASKKVLEGAKQALGFIPNLYANLAESPAALNAYVQIANSFERSSLDAKEQQVVFLAASVENGCEFCVAAHSFIAKNKVRLDAEVVNAIRNREVTDVGNYQALIEFTRAAVRERGWVAGAPLDAFLEAGYSSQQALDVILGITVKTLSNYSNHLTETETNSEFAAEAWKNS